MTPDERDILQPFLQDLAQARGAAKDPEAESLINQAIGANPDAVYLLVQHAILADQALHAAQATIQQLQSQGGQPQASGTSFLGGRAPAPYAGGQPLAQYVGYGDQGYGGAGPARAYGSGPGPVQSNPLSSNGGLGGFLRSAGTMAAGVAAGDFLVNGLSNLFGGGGRDW